MSNICFIVRSSEFLMEVPIIWVPCRQQLFPTKIIIGRPAKTGKLENFPNLIMSGDVPGPETLALGAAKNGDYKRSDKESDQTEEWTLKAGGGFRLQLFLQQRSDDGRGSSGCPHLQGIARCRCWLLMRRSTKALGPAAAWGLLFEASNCG